MNWFFFYSLPAGPSKARVFAWRQLKRLGAINLQSVWVLPHSPERVQSLGGLTEEIEKNKGTALLISGTVVLKSR